MNSEENHRTQSRIKYLSGYYRSLLDIEQQLALGSYHSTLNKSNKRWHKHIKCVGLDPETHQVNALHAVKKKTVSRYTSYSTSPIDRIALEGESVRCQEPSNKAVVTDKPIGYYIDRYCTDCCQLMVRYNGTTIRCLLCGRSYNEEKIIEDDNSSD